MNEKRFRVRFEQEDGRGEIVNEKGVELTAREVVDLLNEQQATIEMYQRRVDKREEQISIIKKYCLKFLTDEQVEIIRKELENG